ncbi:MAG: penicillin-binding protein 1C [Alphaproteobacteria bacterium]
MTKHKSLASTAVIALALWAGAEAGLALHNHKGELPPLQRVQQTGKLVTASNGDWMMVQPAPDGRLRLPARLDRVSPLYLEMLKLWEDRRWQDHRGVDMHSLVRAGASAALNRRIVSGGSTLSMQAARLLRARSTRTIPAKLQQISDALRLEAQLGKTATLEAYLTLLPCGGRMEGVEICARRWFGRDARHLTAAEAALLVAMPQSPEARRPDRHPKAALSARNRILAAARKEGLLDQQSYQEAIATPLPTALHPLPLMAPHLATGLMQRSDASSHQTTSINAPLQRQLEQWRDGNLGRLPDGTELSIIVMERHSGAGLAHIGGRQFGLGRTGGMVDHSRSIRSPGSTLKPFIHALAYDRGIALPQTLLPDLPARFGGWQPANIDGEWRGWLTADEALRRSRNLPVLHLGDRLGMASVTQGLRDYGLTLHLPGDAQPELPMILGGVGVTLQDLTSAYARLAGGHAALYWQDGDASDPAAPVVSQDAGDAVLTSLQPETGPSSALAALDGTAISFKTGTSHGQRDGWCVGLVGPYAVGIWVGRTDGRPVPSLTGIGTVSRLWKDLALTLPIPADSPLPFSSPMTGQAPPKTLMRLETHNSTGPQANDLSLGLGPGPHQVAFGASIPLEITGGTRPFRLLVNQQLSPLPLWRRNSHWTPPGAGYWSLRLIDSTGQDATMTIEVQDNQAIQQ